MARPKSARGIPASRIFEVPVPMGTSGCYDVHTSNGISGNKYSTIDDEVYMTNEEAEKAAYYASDTAEQFPALRGRLQDALKKSADKEERAGRKDNARILTAQRLFIELRSKG